MTDYRERLLDNALAEELGGEQPPDLVQKTVAAAEGRVNGHAVPVQAQPVSPEVHARSWFAQSHVWQRLALAVAACLVTALVVACFLWGDADDELGGPTVAGLPVRNGFYVANLGDAGEFRGTPVLQAGWAFANEKSSELMIGPNLLKFQQARAVVRLGGVPDSYQAHAIASRLEEAKLVRSKEEFQMLQNPRNWFLGLGVAVCLISGSADVNGQEVEASKVEPVTVQMIFDRYDLNDDGILQEDECICHGSKMCDANSDKQVTREEFEAGAKRLMGSEKELISLVQQCGGVDKFYAAAKSGKVAELAAVSVDAVFSYLDKNESGKLEQDECICHGVKMADADSDGIVTREEVATAAEAFFGSEEEFIGAVRRAGGIDEFFKAAIAEEKAKEAAHGTSLNDVFIQYDRNGSGELEKNECICRGTKLADANADGVVTPEEFEKIALEMFGSTDKFEGFIADCGGAAAFYEVVKSGKLPDHGK